MVTQQILVLLFQVRILVAQQSPQPRGAQQGEGTKCRPNKQKTRDARIGRVFCLFGRGAVSTFALLYVLGATD